MGLHRMSDSTIPLSRGFACAARISTDGAPPWIGPKSWPLRPRLRAWLAAEAPEPAYDGTAAGQAFQVGCRVLPTSSAA